MSQNKTQTVAEFLKPHINQWLENRANYKLNKVQIIRATAEIECQIELDNADKARKKEKLVERLERKREKLQDGLRWTKMLLDPIALYMIKELGGYSHEILGPFGLSGDTSIWIYPNEEAAKARDLNSIYSVSFTCNYDYPETKPTHQIIGAKLNIKDYSTNTKQYPNNSMGAANGMNHPNLDIMNWSMEKLTMCFSNHNEEK